LEDCFFTGILLLTGQKICDLTTAQSFFGQKLRVKPEALVI
jgi:hypothetical protein